MIFSINTYCREVIDSVIESSYWAPGHPLSILWENENYIILLPGQDSVETAARIWENQLSKKWPLDSQSSDTYICPCY